MARVTVERALDKCDSRFELVVLMSYRAHAIANGSQTAVNADNKFAVMALREIESGQIDVDELKKTIIEKYLLESQVGNTNDSFIATDASVKFDEDVKNDKKDNEASGKNATLNVSSDYFA